jgi:hypothetical protein
VEAKASKLRESLLYRFIMEKSRYGVIILFVIFTAAILFLLR